MMKRLLSVTLLLLLALSAEAASISGQVVDALSRTPLDGMEIHLKWYGGDHRIKPATDAEGRFKFQLDEILPAAALQRRSLNLLFKRQGYMTENLLLERLSDESFSLQQRLIELAPSEGSEQPLSGAYTTLYVLPYQVSRGSSLSDSEELQALITEYLTSGVDMYLQEIGEPAPLDAFGLQKLGADAAVDISNTSGVISYGHQLKDALAIVGGRAGTRITADQQEQMEFSSRYVIIPAIKNNRGRVLRWDDALPTGLISSRMIADRLNRLWGRNTVLAIAAAALNRSITADTDTRKELLERAEAFLRAELMDAGADEPLVAELNEVLAQIREAQQP